MIKAALAKIGSGFLTGVGFAAAIGAIAYVWNRVESSGFEGRFKPYSADSGLVIENHKAQLAGDNTAFIGSVKNNGKDTWQSISFEVQLFDKDNQFTDKCTGSESGELAPGQSKHFKVSCGGCRDGSVPPYDHYTIAIRDASPSFRALRK